MKRSGYRYGLLDAYEHSKEDPWLDADVEVRNPYVVTGVVRVVASILGGVYLRVGHSLF